ncbi:hypothetical protein [Sorangium sp. So ce381]|uniref:hypothetical protein n=1 Tax=Sorangium sp. So ce381 TaxID=3133307 RepID=UPI003F5AF0E3
MRLLQANSSLCGFPVLSLVAPGCGIAIPGKGTDADEHSVRRQRHHGRVGGIRRRRGRALLARHPGDIPERSGFATH